MYAGKSYRIWDFVLWTRRSIYILLVVGIVPVLLYEVAGFTWLVIPWQVILLLGTTVALMAGFKNTQTYGRTLEAQQVWASIQSKSRSWGSMCRDFVEAPDDTRILIYRHLAWLAALRYAMREKRPWETLDKAPNAEYQRHYTIPEKENSLQLELMKYLPQDELAPVLESSNKATRLLALQSTALKKAANRGTLQTSAFFEMQRAIAALHEQQCRSEALKNYPYPRQYAVINTIFVRIICVLLPFGMAGELEKTNTLVTGFMHGHMVWLAVPLSAIVLWMLTSLDQVSESTANPFEGSANDVPISQICREVEVSLKEMIGEVNPPEPVSPLETIVL